MNLLKQCQSITLSDCYAKESALELGERFLRSGFLDHVEGTKKYQFAFSLKNIIIIFIEMRNIWPENSKVF